MGRLWYAFFIGALIAFLTILFSFMAIGNSGEPAPRALNWGSLEKNTSEKALKPERVWLSLSEKANPEARKRHSETLFLKGEEKLSYVYIYLTPLGDIQSLDPYVCELMNRDKDGQLVTAWVKAGSFEALSSLPGVCAVQEVLPPFVRKMGPAAKRNSISGVSELKTRYGVTGTGMKIGVISDGVDHLSDSQKAGALPAEIHVLKKGKGDEGTAMLEVVHEIAPEAELYFRGAGNSQLDFNDAVDALIAAGCKVICDDIGWTDEPFFEDGVVSSHLQAVLETHDLVYVSAAGNEGKNHYQGMFYDNGSGWHDFSGGTSDSRNLYVNIPCGGKVTVVLQWNDPWKSSGNDYDLYFNDSCNDKVLTCGKIRQKGNSLPFECLEFTNNGPDACKGKICIKKVSGEPRVLEVYIYPEPDMDVDPANLVSEDSIFGHPAVPDVVCVGAVDGRKGEAKELEKYSSRGPVSIYYPSYELREKIDVVGIDNIKVTGAGGFGNTFSGTSASASHVAGVCALVWSAYPEKTGREIREMLYSSAVDLGSLGHDSIFGYGKADVLRMYQLGKPAQNSIRPGLKLGGGENPALSALTGSIPEPQKTISDLINRKPLHNARELQQKEKAEQACCKNQCQEPEQAWKPFDFIFQAWRRFRASLF